MSLCRYLPVPSDRMGIIWSLLSIKDCIILEYGPAGTTHFSMGLYGKLGVEFNQKLFTTHMSEDDVVMGDVMRLEDAIKEIDENYEPKVIFVVASSISAVIGTDIKGVCKYMQNEVHAKLIPFEQGGFRDDYSGGLTRVYKVLVKEFAEKQEAETDLYNIIGASTGRYRMESDIWEIKNIMTESFSMKLNTCLCCDTSVDSLKNILKASVNIVISFEGIEAAEFMKEKYGIPYVLCTPYGYKATMEFLQETSKILNKMPNKAVFARLGGKIRDVGMMRMYSAMSNEPLCPTAIVKGDYDVVCGISRFLEEAGINVQYKICNHRLKEGMTEDILYFNDEKDCLDIFKNTHRALILADDISLLNCSDDNTCLRISSPFINGNQIAKHLPIIGEKGADFLMETIELYYQNILG